MAIRQHAHRPAPELSFVAAVALRFEEPRSVGETPDGVRFHFMLQGSVEGPRLNGKFPLCAAYLLVSRDGVGTISVRAPLLLNDGASAELEAAGRYDFGKDGYERAVAKDLPNSALGWCPRFVTEHPRYLWLNRVLHLGVGELRPREARVDYDLFMLTPALASAGDGAPAASAPPGAAGWPAAAGGSTGWPSGSASPSVSGWAPAAAYAEPGAWSPGGASPERGGWSPGAPHRGGRPADAPASTDRAWDTPPATIPGQRSLYERLGGKAGVDGIARDFVEALVGNVRLNRQNPKVAVEHAKVKGEHKRRAIQLATDMFCKLTGGPCEHVLARPLKDSHVHLDITESDWAIMRVDLDRVLVRHGVARPEREELLAIVENTKSEIVKSS